MTSKEDQRGQRGLRCCHTPPHTPRLCSREPGPAPRLGWEGRPRGGWGQAKETRGRSVDAEESLGRELGRPRLLLWEACFGRVWGAKPGSEGFCLMGGSGAERQRGLRAHPCGIPLWTWG